MVEKSQCVFSVSPWLISSWSVAGHNQTDNLRLREQLGIPVYSARRLTDFRQCYLAGLYHPLAQIKYPHQQLLVIQRLP